LHRRLTAEHAGAAVSLEVLRAGRPLTPAIVPAADG
jgi:hypothetical protein